MICKKAMENAKHLFSKCYKERNIWKVKAEISLFKRNINTSPKNGNKDSGDSFRRFQLPKIGGAAYGMLIIPISTLGLGIWQIIRWQWKLDLIDTMETKVHSDVEPFPHEELQKIQNMEYQKVKVFGYFDYTEELIIGPRSLLKSGDSQPKGLISTGSNAGYLVVTPFKLLETNMTIMVNRGWIPTRNYKHYPSITHPVEIVGVVRKIEHRAPFLGNHMFQRGLWLSRDIPKMAAHLGTEEIFLDLHSIPDLKTDELFPIPGQTRVTLRNEHVSYFTTWFSLSALTGYMWHRRFILRKPLL